MGPTADEACTSIAAVRCAKRQECEPATFVTTWGDLATCTGRDKLACLASITAPGAGNTPYAAWQCPDWFNGVPPAACAQKTGTHAVGDVCTFAAQCGSGFCATSRGAKCGVCAAAPVVGTACGDGVGCGGNGLTCDPTSLTCVVMVTDGGACQSGTCGYGFGCVADGGLCFAEGDFVDAGCDSTERLAPTCRRELGFSCVRRHCVQTSFASAGGACGLDLVAGSFTRCRSGGNCVGDAGTGVSTCVGAANDAVSCESPGGSLCLSPARCVSTDGGAVDAGDAIVGVCQLPSGVVCQ